MAVNKDLFMHQYGANADSFKTNNIANFKAKKIAIDATSCPSVRQQIAGLAPYESTSSFLKDAINRTVKTTRSLLTL